MERRDVVILADKLSSVMSKAFTNTDTVQRHIDIEANALKDNMTISPEQIRDQVETDVMCYIYNECYEQISAIIGNINRYVENVINRDDE